MNYFPNLPQENSGAKTKVKLKAGGEVKEYKADLVNQVCSTELAKKVCPRLRDSACWHSEEITQPWTNFFGQLCMQ